jgi:hypothetical protein
MPIEYNNTLRGTSIIRVEGTGTYVITLNDLRANTTTETVTAFDIKRLNWSTNGSIQISRNSANTASLHNTGEVRLDEWGYAISNNRTANANVTIATGGTLFMEISKEASYNVDPYTG